MQKFDILIVGGGMVGLTLALAIRKTTRLTVAIADNSPLTEINNSDAPADLRVSAINSVSQQLFENLGVWSLITEQRLQPYQQMHIWDKSGYGKLNFSCDDVDIVPGIDHLGCIIENRVIRQALWKKAQQDKAIQFFTDEAITNLGIGESEVFASFTSQMPITAKLVVAADGANSWVRKQMDMAVSFRDYDHHAIVATVKGTQSHLNTAWQVFLETGPCAFLPLFEQKTTSIVWSTSPEEANRLLALSADEFSKELTAASDGKFGVLELQSDRVSFPLTMRMAQDFVKNRVVLVGDAAHTIHPLAGQGVNLGLLDAASLVDVLSEKITELNRCGGVGRAGDHWANLPTLNKYNRWRKSEAAEMIAAMEAIKQVFAPQQAPVKLLRGLGLSLLNNIGPAKHLMVKSALGYKGKLPMLATKN